MPAAAVPGAVAQSNVTGLPLAAESDAVNVAAVVPALPSARETSFTESAGTRSSSVIVPTACGSPICPGAPTSVVRFTTNVSFSSSAVSPTMGTPTTLEVCGFRQ